MDNNEVNIVEEAETEELDKDNKKKSYPTQLVLTIRTIVGVYVVYLAYQIITSGDEKSIPIWAAVVLFIVVGSGLAIMSIKHFICGEYEGGKKDI